MLPMDIRDKLLVDELQLGHSLNDAIHNGDKAYFDLLLSMVSSDVMDDANVVDPIKERVTNEDLRKKFMLAPARSFYSEDADFTRADELGEIIRGNSISGLSLNLALNDAPLAVAANSISSDVINNVSPLCQMKNDLVNNSGSLKHEHFDLCTLAIVDAINTARVTSM
jgi:hypothetical protein